MAEQENILTHYGKLFRDEASKLNGTAHLPFHQFQKASLDALSDVKFPDRKHEDWKYTAVQKLMGLPYALSTDIPSYEFQKFGAGDHYLITILNGHLILDDTIVALRAQGVSILPIKDAFESNSWKSSFSKWVLTEDKSQNRAFEFLNFTFQTSGFFIDIPAHTIIDKPIEIRIAHFDENISFSNPLFFVKVGTSSQVTLIERYEAVSPHVHYEQESLINALGYIHLEKNAWARHIKWQNLPTTQNLVYKLFVTQQRDSRFETTAIETGGKTVRNNVECELEESNTYTSLLGGYTVSGKQSMDHQTRINHKVPYCESHELYKGIIDQQASAAFNGKVFVHQDAQKTNAYQQNDTLVLSPHAVMNSKPQLEIFADDVRCSHGATIGQLDEKALFYLRSRGIRPDHAIQMLKSGFIGEVIDRIGDETIRDYIFKKLDLV